MRLLLVEDEVEIQGFVKQSLIDAGWEVQAVDDATSALQEVTKQTFDGLIVDLGLPDLDGIDLLLRLRRSGISAPVLILSARRSVDERVKGLELGGDDYLTKPFAAVELVARMRSLLRRSSRGEESSHLRIDDLELDAVKRRATQNGHLLNLTPQEFLLLEYLCRNAGRVVTRSMLLAEVWGMQFQPDTNMVDVHVYRLRGKIDPEGAESRIKTLRGVGYVFQRK
ncbi:MAG: response regulator transcription factor [Acidobacteriaceae bacterium]|nr:response regulator transcription factor [Acidobacteriaceae bacterium]